MGHVETEPDTAAVKAAGSDPGGGWAVIRTGGKQYRVHVGQTIAIERSQYLLAVTAEKRGRRTVVLDEVLMISMDGETRVGRPTVPHAYVEADLVADCRARKVEVFHKRRRKNSKNKRGHRQLQLVIRIRRIEPGGARSSGQTHLRELEGRENVEALLNHLRDESDVDGALVALRQADWAETPEWRRRDVAAWLADYVAGADVRRARLAVHALLRLLPDSGDAASAVVDYFRSIGRTAVGRVWFVAGEHDGLYRIRVRLENVLSGLVDGQDIRLSWPWDREPDVVCRLFGDGVAFRSIRRCLRRSELKTGSVYEEAIVFTNNRELSNEARLDIVVGGKRWERWSLAFPAAASKPPQAERLTLRGLGDRTAAGGDEPAQVPGRREFLMEGGLKALLWEEQRITLVVSPRTGIEPGQVILSSAGSASEPMPLADILTGVPDFPKPVRIERVADIEAERGYEDESSVEGSLAGRVVAALAGMAADFFPRLFGRYASRGAHRAYYRFSCVERDAVSAVAAARAVRGAEIDMEALSMPEDGRVYLVVAVFRCRSCELVWTNSEGRVIEANADVSKEIASIGLRRGSVSDDGGRVSIEGDGAEVFGVRLLELNVDSEAKKVTGAVLNHSNIDVLGEEPGELEGLDLRDYPVLSRDSVEFRPARK